MKHESKFSSVLRFNRWIYLHNMKIIARILDFLVGIVFSATSHQAFRAQLALNIAIMV